MTKRKLSMSSGESAGRPDLNMSYVGEYRPSWSVRSYAHGGCSSRFTLQHDGSVVTANSEWYTSDASRTISREAWTTLDAAAAKRLRDWLNANIKG